VGTGTLTLGGRAATSETIEVGHRRVTGRLAVQCRMYKCVVSSGWPASQEFEVWTNAMNRMKCLVATVGLLCLSMQPGGCDSGSNEDSFTVTYTVPFNASSFQTEITNPYLPFPVGTVFRSESTTSDGVELIVVEVPDTTREIAGVTARVVRDRVYLDGELVEDTFDWYAQDEAGNVWYLGEDTKEYENGHVVSTEGSWEAGVDGAMAGIAFPAQPAVGQAYYQEFYEGEAEDRARVLSVSENVSVPAGTFSGCVKTEDTTPLEPKVLEQKFYCRGVGVALEVDVDSGVRSELKSVEQSG